MRWREAHRILPSRYPPIQLFERLTDDPAEWEILAEIESLTNPRVRDEIGEIRLVPAAERVSGPGASWVMASFTHLNPQGSRFSDGSYGVYYAAREFSTAIAETVHHLGRFYGATADPPHAEAMRVLIGKLDSSFHDLRGDALWAPALDPEDYAASRALGRRLRAAGSNGVVYPSVRRAGGQCVGAFRPKAVGRPIQARHLQYVWDGERISRYFDYAEDCWVALEPQH
ncbi:MAG: RES family NAD+ phosphorylase [Geminicoccales bacterium]